MRSPCSRRSRSCERRERPTASPIRTCVGCRTRFEQSTLVRFRRLPAGPWRADESGRPRAEGRGAYLCSERCAVRVAKNKRFAGLALVARAVPVSTWRLPEEARVGYDGALENAGATT